MKVVRIWERISEFPKISEFLCIHPLIQVIGAPFICVGRAAPALFFGLWFPLPPQEPLHMLSTPYCLTAAVCTVHLVRDLGLARLPSACPRVAGIPYAGVGISLVAGAVMQGAMGCPTGYYSGRFVSGGVWRGPRLLSCWDSDRRLSSTCYSGSESS
jgi:hypothetical protein